mgnify:CR=1 FL=1
MILAIISQKTKFSLFIFFELAIYLVKKKVKKTIFYISLLNSFLLFLPLLLTTHNNAHHYLCVEISFYSLTACALRHKTWNSTIACCMWHFKCTLASSFDCFNYDIFLGKFLRITLFSFYQPIASLQSIRVL